MELEADDDQLDFPVVYASARAGVAKTNWDDEAVNMEPLFETLIKEIPAPQVIWKVLFNSWLLHLITITSSVKSQ